jgi:selenocysteine-specific elongation factor
VTLVIGTAGHIDHGKTSLLRALTGIDADRLPEEQRRGMTIDVGYAHLALPDGTPVDFVDVPGHDRLVGNMLVGAGEVDAALLVVAADDGPRAQTLEHLALLDGLALRDGLVVITKADVASPDRVAEVDALIEALVLPTSLSGAPRRVVSSATGEGVEGLRAAIGELVRRVRPDADAGPPRLAVDRAFSVRGRGAVVTGSLRGTGVAVGDQLRLMPGERTVRVREIQVHGERVDRAGSGRTALNLAGIEAAELTRGMVLTADPAVTATDRLLVVLAPPHVAQPGRRAAAWPPRDGARARLHLGTTGADAVLGRGGRDALLLPDGRPTAIVRLATPVAAAPGDRFVLRRASPGSLLAGGVVLDASPARGVSRRRQTADRVGHLAAAVTAKDGPASDRARLDLHGAVTAGSTVRLADDVLAAARAAAISAVSAHHAAHPQDAGMPLPGARTALTRALRRLVTVPVALAVPAADGVIAASVAANELVRDGDRLRTPAHKLAGPDPALLAAMDRLEAMLAAAGTTPPSLATAATDAGCPPDGVRALERSGRIVRLEPDLAYAAATYRELAARALVLAHRGPLTPAAYRDATGTSRKYSLAILEDLDRRGILRRTDAGHVPGPKAPPLPARPSG